MMVQSMVPAGASDPDGEDGHAAHTGESERRARALAQARGRRGVGELVRREEGEAAGGEA